MIYTYNIEAINMSRRATATVEMKSWDENPESESEGLPKLTRARVSNAFHGDIEGEGTVEYLLMYRDDGSASFVGLERVIGRVGDRAGSFVLQHTGTFEEGTAKVTWSVVPGSGTGELRGLRGEGGFAAGHGRSYSATLDYEFV